MKLDKNIFSMKDPKSELIAFDENTIDLVVTAPPVFTLTGKEKLCNNTGYSWETFEDYIDYMGMVFTEVYRVLKNQHYCIITVGDTNTFYGKRQWEKKTYSLPSHFINLLEWIGFTYVSEYTLDKGEKALTDKCRSAYYPFMLSPVSSNEHVLIFVKKGDIDKPVPCPRCGNKNTNPYGYTIKGDRNWVCNECYSHVYFERALVMDAHEKEENVIPPAIIDKWSRGVVQVAPQFADDEARSYLPAEVAEMAMLFYSGVGDVVLDPFSGAGFTILTAIKYDRKYICFERDKNDRQLFYKNLLEIRKNIEKAKSEITEAVKK